MQSPNTVGKINSAVGAAPVPVTNTMTPQEKAVTVPNSNKNWMNPQTHEFSGAPYGLVRRGIGGTTRQFGGPRW